MKQEKKPYRKAILIKYNSITTEFLNEGEVYPIHSEFYDDFFNCDVIVLSNNEWQYRGYLKKYFDIIEIDKYGQHRVLKKTEDDWCPNHEGDKVELSYLGNIRSYNKDIPPSYRVCVWGADDLGMENDFEDKQEGKKLFEKLSRYPVINVSHLKELGFNYA